MCIIHTIWHTNNKCFRRYNKPHSGVCNSRIVHIYVMCFNSNSFELQWERWRSNGPGLSIQQQPEDQTHENVFQTPSAEDYEVVFCHKPQSWRQGPETAGSENRINQTCATGQKSPLSFCTKWNNVSSFVKYRSLSHSCTSSTKQTEELKM